MIVAEVRQLYTYNRWANAEVRWAASVLTEEQLKRPLGSSYSSVLGTLRHILWAEWRWLGRWSDSMPPGQDPQELSEFSQLRERWASFEEAQTQFLCTLRDPDLAQVVSYENPAGTTWSYTLGHMLQHVVNHSTYHRGQVTTLLRQVGAQPRATDLLVFLDVTQGAATGS